MPSVARSTRTAPTSWRVADRSAASLPIFLMSNASTPWRASLKNAPAAQVAADLGISDNLVRWRLRTARQRLRECFDAMTS
jgi:hypothetical protein